MTWVDLYAIFAQFPDTAPKSMHDLKKYEEYFRKTGVPEVADYLMQWRANMQFHIEMEWTEPNEDSLSR